MKTQGVKKKSRGWEEKSSGLSFINEWVRVKGQRERKEKHYNLLYFIFFEHIIYIS
jgi:hypothetical protein